MQVRAEQARFVNSGQTHRAELCKLIVHRRARGRGIGRALMLAAERHACEAGFTLLTLDAGHGGAAEDLYRALGWDLRRDHSRLRARYRRTDLHGTVIFYKQLGLRPLGGQSWGCCPRSPKD